VSLTGGPVYTLTILTLAIPLLFGMFWGSPAVARERETGTVQFAWTQSVTRRRWLSVKAGWLLLAGAIFGGALAAIITWWYAPLNALNQNQFAQGSFDIQGIVPIGYAVFAVALGITAGALIGRSLPTLAVTGGVFLAVRLVVTYWVRVHYMPAVTAIHRVTQNFTPKGAYWPLARGVVLPGGQLTTNLIVGPGEIVSTPGGGLPAACQALGLVNSILAYLARFGYRSFTTYQRLSNHAASGSSRRSVTAWRSRSGIFVTLHAQTASHHGPLACSTSGTFDQASATTSGHYDRRWPTSPACNGHPTRTTKPALR
jgi:hypothetical protein